MAFWLDQVLGRAREGMPGKDDSAPIWDAVSDWMLRIQRDGTLMAANTPRGGPFPPLGPDDLGRPAARLFPKRAAAVLMELLPRTLDNGKPSTFEYAFGKSYAEARLFPLDREEVVLVARDLTGRKSTEATLRRGRERYALAVQGANDGLWDWQLDTDTVYYSLQWKAMLGLDHTDHVDPVPQSWLSRVHPEDMQRVEHDLERHLVGDTPRFENEHRIQHVDGEWMWVLVRGMALRNAQGEATRIAGSLTDLTHRRVVAAAEEKGLLLEYATRAVGIGIAILMPGGQLTQISPTLGDMAADWPSVSAWWHQIVAETELPRGIRCPRCRRRQHVGSMLAEVEAPTGEPRVFEITITGHAHEVHAVGSAHVVLVEDVTEPKLAERRLQVVNAELIVARDRALASSRAKSTFLANMSHELRTPLNAILGYSEMLLEELEDAEVEVGAEELERINTAGSHLLELISGILDLSKIEAGIMTLEVRTFEVHTLVDEVVGLVATAMEQGGNAFESDCPEDLPPLTTDPGKLRQILQNLLSNAAKFTDHGTVRLSIAPSGDDMVFRVADTGIGMDDATRSRLFEEFFQGDLSSTKRYGGAGLGLALCRKFADMMGGTIEVDSVLGEGSTFDLRLPRQVPSA